MVTSKDWDRSVKAAVLAKAAKYEQVREWQPISTAPKDGTLILLMTENGCIRNGGWQERQSGHGWYLHGGDMNKPDSWYLPAYWMGLPPCSKNGI